MRDRNLDRPWATWLAIAAIAAVILAVIWLWPTPPPGICDQPGMDTHPACRTPGNTSTTT